jgi:hypothetical protein
MFATKQIFSDSTWLVDLLVLVFMCKPNKNSRLLGYDNVCLRVTVLSHTDAYIDSYRPQARHKRDTCINATYTPNTVTYLTLTLLND